MSKVSFLIPTNKPAHFLEAVVNSIVAAQQNSEHTFELIYYSKEPILSRRDIEVKWLEDRGELTIPNSYNEMARLATGDYLYFSADDYGFEPNFFQVVDQAELRKDNIVLALEHRGHPHYPTRHAVWPILGTALVSRECYEGQLGGSLINGHFLYHYADCYLTAFLGFMDTPGEIVTYTGMRKLINHPTHTLQDDHDEKLYDKLFEELRNGSRTRYV
jgi:hypothetical protein